MGDRKNFLIWIRKNTVPVYSYVSRDDKLDLKGTESRKSLQDKAMRYSSTLQLRVATGFWIGASEPLTFCAPIVAHWNIPGRPTVYYWIGPMSDDQHR
jgi:hypothetical protein